jgi:hypothetical protein
MSASLIGAFGKSREPGNPGLGQAAVVVASPYSAVRMLGAAVPSQPPAMSSQPAMSGQPAAPGPDRSAETGTQHLVVPFATPALAQRPGVTGVSYDYDKAYAAMGAEAARRLLRRRGGESRNCAIVFQPNFMRTESALQAFSAAFAATAGPDRLRVLQLPSDPDAVDSGGSAATAIKEAVSGGAGLVVLAMDGRTQASDAAASEAAAAAGAAVPAGTAVTTSAAAKVKNDAIIYFADTSTWGEVKSQESRFACWIEADDKAMARATIGRARALAAAGTGAKGIKPTDAGTPDNLKPAVILVRLRVRKPFLQIF